MIQFVLGALAGAAAAWYWRQDIERHVKETMPDLRAKAADRLQSMEKTAEDMIDKAKTGVVSRMRVGEDKLRGTHDTPATGQGHGERSRPQG